MSKLQMPRKGQSAAMMAELQSEHAAQPTIATEEPTNVVTLQGSNERTTVSTTERPLDLTPEPAPVTTNEPTNQPENQAPEQPAPAEDSQSRAARLAVAMDRAAEDSIAVVTVRVPAGLNRYMDDYVARINRINHPSRYRKQDAVAEAFAAFYADHIMPPPPPDEDI
jgi:hypothetical protein